MLDAGAARGEVLVPPVVPAVQDEVRLDDVEGAAERLGVGAVRGDEGGADAARLLGVEDPGVQRGAQAVRERQEQLLELGAGQ
ncbi:hypothetical protein STTU_0496 [Streptomyces sp. Tu6071]|nr:hypothetical protein STTU_0496 [Streptomyces sp. Tu6071]